MARVDAIIDQQHARHIILECGLIATTFQQKRNLVLKKHHDREVEEEPATVTGDKHGSALTPENAILTDFTVIH